MNLPPTQAIIHVPTTPRNHI